MARPSYAKVLRSLLVFSLIIFLANLSLSTGPIHLEGHSFEAEENRNQVQGLGDNSVKTEASESNYKVLQFEEPTTESYREKIADKGLEFLYYVPENAWVINSSAERKEIISKKKVRYLGPYRPEYRISSEVERKLEEKNQVSVRVSFFSKPSKKFLEKFGKGLSDVKDLRLRLQVSSSDVKKLASYSKVKRISLRRPELKTFNDVSRDLIGADRVHKRPFDLTGEGFTAAIWDKGLAGEHGDLNYSGKRTVGDFGIDVLNHATHVAGTMLGGGKLNNSLRGVAPDSDYVTYRWPDGSDFIQELKSETQDSADYGSVVSQNSWGYGVDGECDLMGGYFEASAAYDNITHGTANQEKMLFVFSAGNQRSDESCGGLGYSYNTTTGPGATAKNTLSVGAVGDLGYMTSYSSWGPTDDGRLKPDVIADGGCGFGTGIKSTLPGNRYGSLCGTSMASPAVSGTVLLMNQQFNKTYDRLPDPATAKGLIIHNAKDLNTTGPDYRTGYGLVNATDTIDYVKKSRRQGLIQTGAVGLDEADNYTLNVSEQGPAKFSLVWSDYPAQPSNGKALVNDLDLRVYNSSGHRFYPWTLNWSERKGSADRDRQDRKNNVVQVYIPNMASDQINVSVHGETVPEGPQSYSLMLTEKKWRAPELNIESPENISYNETPDFNFSSDTQLDEVKFSIDGGSNRTMANTSNTHFYNSSTNLTEAKHQIKFYAYNKAWTNRTKHFTVDKTNPELRPISPLEDANISGITEIQASWNDTLSGIENTEYKFTNSTGFKTIGGLNTTFNSSKLVDGEYNLTYSVTDSAGNTEEKRFNVTVDNTAPEFIDYSPENKAVNSNFTINASYSEDGTGLKKSFYRLSNSSDKWEGQLNDTIDFSKYQNGNYSLDFILQDYAGNKRVKNSSVVLDNQRPSLEIETPTNGSYISQEFDVNASFEDNLSGIRSANYSLDNGKEISTGPLNSTVSNNSLEEGLYNITFRARDFAGNIVEKRINVTLDSGKPYLEVQRPQDEQLITGNFSVNASTFDEFSGIETNTYIIERNSQQVLSGQFNDTVNSSEIDDGKYSVIVKSWDKAGNERKVVRNISIDNRPPVLEESSIQNGSNISGAVDINATFEDVSGLENSSFRLYNQSGNVTQWQGLNYTDFDTLSLENGSYNLSLRSKDSLGKLKTYNISDVLIDNQAPEIEVSEESSQKYNGWIKDSKTVTLSCTDQLSDVKNISVNVGSSIEESNSSSGVFELDRSGNNSYKFACTDYAGNKLEEEKFYSIDTKGPQVKDLNPNEGSLTSLDLTLNIDFSDESERSGIDTGGSALSLQNTDGEIASTRWTNSSVTAEIRGLEPSTNFSVTGQITDNLGHTENIQASYMTLSPSQAQKQALMPTSTKRSSKDTLAEEKFLETGKGLSANNLRIESGETREINVSKYSEGTLSTIKLLGAQEGLLNLTVESLDKKLQKEGLVANRYMSIDVSNASLVRSGTLTFYVEKNWIKSQNVKTDSLQLYREKEDLQDLETVLIGNYSERLLFRVDLDAFSNFVVAGQVKCGERVSAVSPDANSCQNFVSTCEKPDAWDIVRSCSAWEDRKKAQEALENLSKRDVSREKIESVQQEINQGNYSGAIQKAENIQKEGTENQTSNGNPLILVISVISLLLVLPASSYLGIRYHRKRKLEREINWVGEKLMDKSGEEKLNKYTTMTDKVIQSKKALQMNEYERARQKIQQYNEEAEQRGLDVPEPELVGPIYSLGSLKNRFIN